MADIPFLIAAPHVGLERDLESWLIPNDAYPQIEDAYLWRGRIKKKQGYNLLGRLRRLAGTGGAAATITFTIPGVSVTTPLTPRQSTFTFGNVTFVDFPISPIAGNFFFTSGGALSNIDYTTGIVTLNLTSPVGTDAFYFSGLPVMGLPTLDQLSIAQSPIAGTLMGFDPKFAYFFDDVANAFQDASFYKPPLPINPTPLTWTGDDADFFWSLNYANALWATNFKKGFQSIPNDTQLGNGDGIRWFDQDKSGWINYLPPINAAHNSFLGGALMMVTYKGRLLALNTWEGTNFGALQNFPQRARWCQIGSPFYDANKPTNFQGGANQIDAWNSDTPGFGGFIDAPTSEQIVSCQFLKDTLIVYFQNSTWQLAYNGNEILPFVWVKINTELGALSTFSEVPFDKIVLGVGSVGIHACDTVNVERIDQKIPDEVFAISGSNFGRERVYGIRDYYTQLVYWTLPYSGADQSGAIDDVRATLPPPGIELVYPNRVLAYNYLDESYSFFNDSFTAFGYYARGNTVIWGNGVSPIGQITQWQATSFPWVSSSSLPAFPYVIAGNQQGFVEIFDPQLVTNSVSLFISNIIGTAPATITSLNHNLFSGMIVGITNNGSPLSYGEVTVLTKDTFSWDGTVGGGAFAGNASIVVVPIFNVITKRFSPFIEEASQNRISFIDLYVDRTTLGKFQVVVYQDEDNSQPTNELTVATFPETTYTNDPDTIPFQNSKIWKRVFMTQVAQEFQLQFTLSNDQLKNPNIAASQITIHAIILWIAKGGRLTNS